MAVDNPARILAISAQAASSTESDIITETACGAIPAGTFIPAGTPYNELIPQLLGATPTTVSIYMGALTNKPTSMSDIPTATKKDVVDTTLLNTSGYIATIKAGDPGTRNAQYPFIALPKGAGTPGTADYTLLHWYPSSISTDYEYEHITTATHTIYYLKYPSYDEDLGGNSYKFFIKKTVF